MTWHPLLVVVSSIFLLLMVRVWAILPTKQTHKLSDPKKPTRTLAIFLGSGGHTNEMLRLVSSLDFERYNKRIYMMSEGDILSANKAIALEKSKDAGSFNVINIPRARSVHQSLLTTPKTMSASSLHVIYHVTCLPVVQHGWSGASFADVLLLNGPGTCLAITAAIYLNKFLGLPAPRLFYIESFARVKKLSLSGRLLRPLVDRFVVQWPRILADKGQGECYGWLI